MPSTGAMESPTPERGKPGDCEVIERPNELKRKVKGSSSFNAKMMERAEKVIAEEKVAYLRRIGSQIDQIDGTFGAMRDTGHFDADRLWSLVHDLRSEAGTFGYPMLTQIGGSLCDLLQKLETPQPRDLKVITTHITAMRTVVAQRLEGDDNDIANEVAAALRDMVEGYV